MPGSICGDWSPSASSCMPSVSTGVPTALNRGWTLAPQPGRSLSRVRRSLLLYAADHHQPVRSAAGTHCSSLQSEQLLPYLAGSIGVSITTTLWTCREALHHTHLTESITPYNPIAQQAYGEMEKLGLNSHQASALIAQDITAQGLIISANEIFWAAAGVFLVLLILIWFAKPPSPAQATAAAPTDPTHLQSLSQPPIQGGFFSIFPAAPPSLGRAW